MAPRFRHNMFQIYLLHDHLSVLVCFAEKYHSSISAFLTNMASRLDDASLFRYQIDSEPTPLDHWIRYFKKDEESTIQAQLDTRIPILWKRLFHTTEWESYIRIQEKIKSKAIYELETSHDHPCIEIHDRSHPEEELESMITSVASKLNIPMTRNQELPPIDRIIMSNRIF